MRVYMNKGSLNCYKVRLLLSHLGVAYEPAWIASVAGEGDKPEYRKKNPHGLVPLLETDDGRFLPESNAILFYLADGTPMLPAAAFDRGHVLRWMFFEREHLGPAVQHIKTLVLALNMKAGALYRRIWDQSYPGGYEALRVLEAHLSTQDFLVGSSFSVADVCMFAHAHVMRDVNYDMDKYPAVTAWLERCKAQPGHITSTHGIPPAPAK